PGDMRVFAGSPSGYFDVIDNEAGAGGGFTHSLRITFLTDGLPAAGGKSIEGVMKERIASLFPDAEIGDIDVDLVGLEEIRNAFSKKSSAVRQDRAEIQRMFVRMLKEDIQIAGDCMLGKEIEDDILRFEGAYISEYIDMSRKLEDRLRSIDGEKVLEEDLDEEEARDLASLKEQLSRKRREIAALNEDIKAERTRLAQESEDLDKTLAFITQAREKTEKAGGRRRERAEKAISEAIESYIKLRERLNQDTDRVDAEAERLVSMVDQKDAIKQLIEPLNSRKHRADAYRWSLRMQDLLCKKVEDAQFAISKKRTESDKDFTILPGVLIDGKYRVKKEIGRGGYGAVYRVYDIKNDQEMAVKILLPTVSKAIAGKREEILRDFDEEIRISKKLKFERAMVPIYESRGVYAGLPYFSMSLERGKTLEEIIDEIEEGKLELSSRAKVILMHVIARALSTIHKAGIVHRDIKPANINIPVNEEGELEIPDNVQGADLFKDKKYVWLYDHTRIMDLGLGIEGEYMDARGSLVVTDEERLKREGDVGPGTPWFMAPEQLSQISKGITGRTDVYALGATFYKLFSGRYPIGNEASSGRQIVSAHLQKEKPLFLREAIAEENRSRRLVSRQTLEKIRKGLTGDLAKYNRSSSLRVFETDKKHLFWAEEVLYEDVLRERLARMGEISPQEAEGIVYTVMSDAARMRGRPQADGYIEALVDKMIQREASGRPDLNSVIEEAGKHLKGFELDMEYVPHDKKWDLLTDGAYWLKQHQKVFAAVSSVMALLLASAAGTLYYLYRLADNRWHEAEKKIKAATAVADKARQREAAAKDATRIAREEKAQAEKTVSEAHRAVLEAREEKAKLAEQVKQLNDDLKELTDSLSDIKKKKGSAQIDLDNLLKEWGSAEKKKASLRDEISESVSKVEELKKQSAELAEKIEEAKRAREKAEKESEDARKKLEGYRNKLDEAGDKLEKANRDLSALQERLAEAEKKIDDNLSTIAGVFLEASSKARAMEPEKAMDVLNKKLKWWDIADSRDNFMDFSRGFDRLARIMLDNAEFDMAMKALEQKMSWITVVSNWGVREELKLMLKDELISTRLNMLNIMRLNESYADAEKYAGELFQKKEFSESGDRTELLRRSAVMLKIEHASSMKDRKTKEEKLSEAADRAKELEDESAKTYFLALADMVGGEFRKAEKGFREYHDHWKELAGEDKIAPEVSAGRKRKAAYGLLMAVFCRKRSAESHGDKGEKEDARADAMKAAAAIKELGEKYPGQREMIELSALAEAGLQPLLGNTGKEAEIYKEMKTSAKGALAGDLIRIKLAGTGYREPLKGSLSDLMDVDAEIPFAFRGDLRELYFRDAGERKKALLEKKRAGDALRKLKESVKDQKDAERRIIISERVIKKLESAKEREEDRKKKKRLEDQLRKEYEKKKTLESILEEMRKRSGHSDAPAGKRGAGFSPRHSEALPIASCILLAPDHALVNAVIAGAMEEGLFSRESPDVVLLGGEAAEDLKDVYNSLQGKNRIWLKFREDLRARGISDGMSSKIYREGLGKLEHVSGHAGMEEGVVYAVKGSSERDTVILHERKELSEQYRACLSGSGYDSWEEVPSAEKRPLIEAFRSSPGYGEAAIKAHEIAGKEHPVSVRPVYGLEVMAGIVRKLADLLAPVVVAGRAAYESAGLVPEKGRGLILFADDIVDSSAVFDLEELAKAAGRKAAVGKIVLYASEPGKAELIEKIIKEQEPAAEVISVYRDDLKEFYGEEYYRMIDLEAVLKYVKNRKISLFRDSGEILGVVRGALDESENAEEIRQKLEKKSLRVPVVVFKDSVKGNIYSIMDAVAELIEARRRSPAMEKGVLILLPPITRVSEALQEEYLNFRLMAKALESAA
ncbi:MAG: protein kinase, partial [Candidatus Omnitrophica bacterium]|nr:protein kinase [Candidatus Omnitrophota bacterium]